MSSLTIKAQLSLTLITVYLVAACYGNQRCVKPYLPANRFTLGAPKSDFYIYKYDLEAIKNRPISRQIHPMILARRSLRDMNGQSIKNEDLMSLFEAARWAPSHFNTQTWRFVYTTRNSRQWDKYLDALSPGNRKWAKDAAVLMVALSKKTQNYKGRQEPVPSHSFDTGAAWMAMALEGTARGLVVHAMGGFDQDKAANMIGLKGTDYQIEAMIAIGNRAKNAAPEKTTQRNEVEKFISEGVFTEKLK